MSAAEPPTSARVRLLVLDDEPLIGVALRRLLRRSHEVTCFASGREALDWLAEGHLVDLLLTDVRMPGMDGPTFLRELAARRSELLERVFLLTATPPDELPESLTSWRERVIEKPFEGPQLRALLSEVIERLGRLS